MFNPSQQFAHVESLGGINFAHGLPVADIHVRHFGNEGSGWVRAANASALRPSNGKLCGDECCGVFADCHESSPDISAAILTATPAESISRRERVRG